MTAQRPQGFLAFVRFATLSALVLSGSCGLALAGGAVGEKSSPPTTPSAAPDAPPATPATPEAVPPAAAQAPAAAVPGASAPDAAAAPLPAPQAPPPDLEELLAPVKETSRQVEAVERDVERFKNSEPELAKQRAAIDAISGEADKATEAIRPRLDAAKAQLDQLGPGPKAGQPAEAMNVATERARLTAVVTTLEGALKSVDLARVRARQLASRVQDLRRGMFTENLFERLDSPLLPGLWSDLLADWGSVALQFENVFGTWRAVVAQRLPALFGVLFATLFAYGVLYAGTRRAIDRLVPRAPPQSPSYTSKARAATLAAPLYMLPTIAAATCLYAGFDVFGLVYSRVQPLWRELFYGVATFTVVTGLANAILAPRKPDWRLIDLANGPAFSLWRSVRMVALIYSADQVVEAIIQLLDLPLAFHVALSLVTTLAFALVLLRVVATPMTPQATIVANAPMTAPGAAEVSRWHPRWLKLPLAVIAVAIVAAALSGYISLARFAAGQVVITGSAVVLAILLHLVIRTAERAAVSDDAWLGQWLQNGMGLGETHRQLVGHAISTVLNIALAVVAVPALLLAWGFSVADVSAGMRSALFGFEIGHFRISLVRLFMAAALFASLLFATRMIQRWLRATFLRPDRMDAGIANSIYQGIGYVGFGVAVLLSISFGGIDITNLAILAGALSVGIGFGLQSIVNNFVSGLILLVERPIKVGDWIVLKDGGQGYVRSISVRSTEIETFDRSSLIVPNSELISNVVTNWTHRNALGRVVVKVATSYKSDPEKVLEVLTACARESPMVMPQPAPLITLDNFGGDGLEFSVRVVVPDINRALSVQTDLRTRIFRAFQANGIEFPTSERGVYLRDLDGLKTALGRVLEERAARAAAAAAFDGTDKG